MSDTWVIVTANAAINVLFFGLLIVFRAMPGRQGPQGPIGPQGMRGYTYLTHPECSECAAVEEYKRRMYERA